MLNFSKEVELHLIRKVGIKVLKHFVVDVCAKMTDRSIK